MEVWQNKIRRLCSFLKHWAKNLSSVYKEEQKRLLSIIDTLDIKAETTPLNASERDALREDHDKISSLRRDEESK